jgi:hypothetical protein
MSQLHGAWHDCSVKQLPAWFELEEYTIVVVVVVVVVVGCCCVREKKKERRENVPMQLVTLVRSGSLSMSSLPYI